MKSRTRLTLRPRKYSFRRKLVVGLFFLAIVFLFFKGTLWLKNAIFAKEKPAEQLVEKTEEISTPEIKKNTDRVVEYTISTGDIPAEVFQSNGKLDANDVESLLSCAKDVYDFTNIKVGQKLRFYFDEEEKTKRIEYDKNNEALIVVERKADEFSACEEKISYEVSQSTARGKIENFFYVDAMEAGLQEATVLEVGDIFSFDIDFTTEIQRDDEFVIIYEKRSRDGQSAPDGKILGAKFINSGTAYFAYYFDNGGKGGYYDADGRLLERQFLKAPLSYRHISSGFTGARMHPITRKVSAHYQIDYAAPTGTPVSAAAHGTVVSAHFEGGWGNIIRLTHDNGYTTHYGHLSKFSQGLRVGERVSRGQIIGYVGSTGWSTGPHLDYGVKLNGVPVNPLKLDLPKGEPITGEQIKLFEETKNKFGDLLK
ncbi:MAG: peptidoglycan DD-metalloendopeptidase family protein [bacterium]|nr:peptidoglycan DD-metalloendopeptidase family protein [bacterium]